MITDPSYLTNHQGQVLTDLQLVHQEVRDAKHGNLSFANCRVNSSSFTGGVLSEFSTLNSEFVAMTTFSGLKVSTFAIEKSYFHYSVFKNVDFTLAVLKNTDFLYCAFEDCTFHLGEATSCTFRGCKFVNTTFGSHFRFKGTTSFVAASGIRYVELSFDGFGEANRKIMCVEVMPGIFRFFCGCFAGSYSTLRSYINARAKHTESREKALSIIIDLIPDAKNEPKGELNSTCKAAGCAVYPAVHPGFDKATNSIKPFCLLHKPNDSNSTQYTGPSSF